MMNHGCFVKCVLWPGNAHDFGLNVLIDRCWNVTGTSTTSGSTVSESERTCKSPENNIAWHVGRQLQFDPESATFIDDDQANTMRTRPEYRQPWVLPEV